MDFDFNNSFLCFHPSFLDKKCTLCNLPIIACGNGLITTPLSYIHPKLALTLEEVDRVRDDNLRHLLQSKKLHLVLDLDHTLIHSRLTKKVTLDEKQHLTCTKDVYNMLSCCRYVKLRPGVHEFIKQVSSMFDLSIYTMADKVYAQDVRGLLESKAGFPRLSWVIAKQDCTKYRQKRLDVVLSHERVVLIVDDTENIWGDFCTENLVKISRYEFFPIKEQEEEIDTELARVFGLLKMVHDKFYDVDFEVEDEVVFGTRDVREILDSIFLNTVFDEGNERCCAIKSRKRSRDECTDFLLQNSCVQQPAKYASQLIIWSLIFCI